MHRQEMSPATYAMYQWGEECRHKTNFVLGLEALQLVRITQQIPSCDTIGTYPPNDSRSSSQTKYRLETSGPRSMISERLERSPQSP
jgi:hypothetical protein